MKTFLFVTWWGGGNQNPLLALGTRLQSRGHRIRVLGSKDLSPAFAAQGFERTTCAGPLPGAGEVLDELIRAPADALVVDYMATDALCGAERSGVPTAALVHTLYRGLLQDGELTIMGMAGGLGRVNGARAELGLTPVERLAELLDRTAAVLVTTLPQVDAPSPARLPANVHYVGPLLEGPGSDEGWTPPWPADDERPLVVVSLGTTPMDEEAALQRVLDAAAGVAARVFVTAGSHLHLAAFAVPNNVVMAHYVHHAAVLPAARLLVTHCGLGSVSAALGSGVPMLCMPLGREQPTNAARVAALGAGRVLPPTADPAAIADAMREVLADASYADAARRIAAAIAAAAADDPAVRVVEAIARG